MHAQARFSLSTFSGLLAKGFTHIFGCNLFVNLQLVLYGMRGRFTALWSLSSWLDSHHTSYLAFSRTWREALDLISGFKNFVRSRDTPAIASFVLQKQMHTYLIIFSQSILRIKCNHTLLFWLNQLATQNLTKYTDIIQWQTLHIYNAFTKTVSSNLNPNQKWIQLMHTNNTSKLVQWWEWTFNSTEQDCHHIHVLHAWTRHQARYSRDK